MSEDGGSCTGISVITDDALIPEPSAHLEFTNQSVGNRYPGLCSGYGLLQANKEIIKYRL